METIKIRNQFLRVPVDDTRQKMPRPVIQSGNTIPGNIYGSIAHSEGMRSRRNGVKELIPSRIESVSFIDSQCVLSSPGIKNPD